MALDIGQVAYQAYVDSWDGKDNFPFPKWEELEKDECDAWRHAAVAVLQEINRPRAEGEIS